MFEMKKFLIEQFEFNSSANKKILSRIPELPDQHECIKYFSHLINSQIKWLDRILKFPDESKLSWWDPVYNFNILEEEWNKSTKAWINFIEEKDDEELFKPVRFIGFDGGEWTAEIKDIALQLNFHSIHHRAQIQAIIRQQGFEPDFIDYIGTRYRKIS